MAYVDFVCIPISEEKIEAYIPGIEVFAKVMKDYGMTDFCEALADDVPKGELTDFYKAVKVQKGETVITALMRWPDKETRDIAWDKGMKDSRIEALGPEGMPFDGKRMFWGGFKPLCEFYSGT